MPKNTLEELKKTILDAPNEPGVYIMRGEGQQCEIGEIIYIGKAKSLKNRLKSYFTGEKDPKTTALMKKVHNIETIIVPTEYDALLLENTLIKQHSPKYNINLKDGKTYPVIRITNEDFPRIFRTRKIINDNSLYYGPFPDTQAVISAMELIDKLFPLRKCKSLSKTKNLKKRKSPCMYYHIGRCSSPCSHKISIDEYNVHVEQVKKLLEGNTDNLIIDLTEKMHQLARDLQFEKAAYLRNAILAVENLAGERNAVEDLNPEDRDYIAWASEGLLTTFTVFSMRGGKMTGRDLFRTHSASDESESLELFITSYYNKTKPPPKKIYFMIFFSSCGLCGSWLKNNFNFTPEFITPTDKHHSAIMAMAQQNAKEDLRKRLKERGAGPALEELARNLNLETKPLVIEGFDISHLDGKFPVASLVSFKNGVPDKKNYRHYKLRTLKGKIDDFQSMREVMQRRYSRLIREGLELPDLILIDGGLGQVNASAGIIEELGINIDIIGLAKENEEIWLPNVKKPIVLSKDSEALKVLMHVRDESHRFANSFNQKLRSKALK